MPEGMRMLKPPAASATSRGTIACAGHLFSSLSCETECKPGPHDCQSGLLHTAVTAVPLKG